MEAGRVFAETRQRPSVAEADQAIAIIDCIITDVYLPSRGETGYGTERAILPEQPHTLHRENIAEHSLHLALTARVLYDNRDSLGLYFPEDFNADRAVSQAIIHDIPEVWARDVDAMTRDEEAIRLKTIREMAAVVLMRQQHPYLKNIADDWESYEHKETFEDDFVNDLDKVISTRMICVDGGRRWHDWEGQQTSREFMLERMRGKLRTENGHALFDAIERDLDNHPELFPDYAQERLF